MGNRITVEVRDQNGPVADKHVKVRVHGVLDGGELSDYTDESGHVELETEGNYPDHRKIDIYVDDEFYETYYIGDEAFTVTIEGEEGEEYDKEQDMEQDREEKEAW